MMTRKGSEGKGRPLLFLMAVIMIFATIQGAFAYTWTNVNDSAIKWTRPVISSNGQTLVVSDGTYVYKSTDKGVTMNMVNGSVGLSNAVAGSVAASADLEYIYARQAGTNALIRSTDQGATWEDMSLGTIPVKIFTNSTGGCVVVGRGQDVKLSIDYGVSFLDIYVSPSYPTVQVAAGIIFADDTCQRIYFAEKDTGGGTVLFYYSVDGGSTWNTTSISGTTFLMTDVSKDGSVIYGINDTDLLRSTDSGVSFSRIDPPGPNFATGMNDLKCDSDCSVVFYSEWNTTSGTTMSFYISSDSGSTWPDYYEKDGTWFTTEVSSDGSVLYAADFASEGYFWMGGPPASPIDPATSSSYYNFENDVNDRYGLNNLTNNGASFSSTQYPSFGLYGRGKNYSALFVASEDDYINSTSNVLQYTDTHWVSMWVKFNSLSWPQVLFSKSGSASADRGWYVGVDGSGYPYVAVSEDGSTWACSPTSSIGVQMGVWYHFVGQRNSTGCYFFVNGALSASSVAGFGNTYVGVGADYFTLGSWPAEYVGSFDLDGYMDEVRVGNTSLTDAQVYNLYLCNDFNECTGDWVNITGFDGATSDFNVPSSVDNPIIEKLGVFKIIWNGLGLNFSKANFSPYVKFGEYNAGLQSFGEGHDVDLVNDMYPDVNTGLYVGVLSDITLTSFTLSPSESGITKCYVYDSGWNELASTTNISDYVAYFTPVFLSAAPTYYFACDAEGGSYTTYYADSVLSSDTHINWKGYVFDGSADTSLFITILSVNFTTGSGSPGFDHWVSVPSENLPADVNTSANITFHEAIGFVGTPTLKRDGVLCGDCDFVSYNGSDAIFTVPHFSNYTLNNESGGAAGATYVYLASPANGTTATSYDQNFTFWFDSTNETSLGCDFYVNSTIVATNASVSNATNTTLSNSTYFGANGNGDYTWYVQCGANVSETRDLIMDVPLSVVSVSPADSSTLTSINANFTFNATNSAGETCVLRVNGTTIQVGFTNMNASWGPYNISSVVLSGDGQYSMSNSTFLQSINDDNIQWAWDVVCGVATTSKRLFKVNDVAYPALVKGCYRELDESGREYNLVTDISSPSGYDCLLISNNNIVLDCKGYTVARVDSGVPIYNGGSNFDNAQIKNCKIESGTGANIKIGTGCDGWVLTNITHVTGSHTLRVQASISNLLVQNSTLGGDTYAVYDAGYTLTNHTYKDNIINQGFNDDTSAGTVWLYNNKMPLNYSLGGNLTTITYTLNTTKQAGTPIAGGGPYIGGNYYPGYSDNGSCADANYDGICDSSFQPDASIAAIDYLPLTNYTPCTPNWSCSGYASCLINDTQYCNAVTDLNTCGQNYTGDYSEFSPNACDYCTPSWSCIGYASCLINDTQYCNSVNDSNGCYAQTSLPSDQYAGNYSEFSPNACDYCTPSWFCGGYSACAEIYPLLNGTQSCTMANDTYGCYAQTSLPSDQYAGNLSEFLNQSCVYRSAYSGAPNVSYPTNGLTIYSTSFNVNLSNRAAYEGIFVGVDNQTPVVTSTNSSVLSFPLSGIAEGNRSIWVGAFDLSDNSTIYWAGAIGVDVSLDPEVSSQDCAALTYPNEDDQPSQAVIPANFSVFAPLGFSSPSAVVNLTYNASVYYASSTCNYTVIDSTHRNYTCGVLMHYYYLPGDYDLRVSYVDGSRNASALSVDECAYGALIATRRVVSTVSFPTARPGISNAISSSSIPVENTGNVPLSISTTAHDLIGRQNAAVKLPASSFKMGTALVNSTQLQDNVQVNLSAVAGLAQTTNLWLWLSMASNQQVQDYYSSTPWTIIGTG